MALTASTVFTAPDKSLSISAPFRRKIASLSIFLAAYLALFLLPIQGGIFATELRIDAPRFTFDRESGKYSYEEGHLTWNDLSLFANKVELDQKAKRVSATGMIRFEKGTFLGTAEEMVLDTSSGGLRFRQVSIYDGKSGLYLTGGEVIFHPEGRMEVRDCTLTTCPADVPGGWSLSTSELNLRPDNFAVAWNPVFRVGPVPVFWLPLVAWPTVKERQTGFLIPEITREQSSLPRLDLGWRLKVPVFVNLGVDQDLTVIPEWIENRGGALGLEYNYAFMEGMRGQIAVFSIKEQRGRVYAEENDFSGTGANASEDPYPARFHWDWAHNQEIGESSRFILDLHHSSDGQVRREYQGVTEYRPYRTYQLSLTHQSGWSGTALTTEQNADYSEESLYADVLEDSDLAERPQLKARFSARLGARPFEALPVGLDVPLAATRFNIGNGTSGEVYSASPSLVLPISLGGAFELRGRYTQHVVSYTDLNHSSSGDLEAQSYRQWEREVELRTSLARVYRGEGDRYPAIKHRLTPRLIFSETEDALQYPPEMDEQVQVLPGRVARSLITLRLDNTWLARTTRSSYEQAGDPASTAPAFAGPSFELARLDWIQRYNLLLEPDAGALTGLTISSTDRQETDQGQPLLPLLVEGNLNGGWYGIDFSVNYHHQLKRSTRSSLSIDGTLGSHTLFKSAYAFNEFGYRTPENRLIPATESLGFQGELALGDQASIGFKARANLKDNPPPLDRRIDKRQLFFDYHPVCYNVRMNYSEEVATSVESSGETYYVDKTFTLTFNLTGLVGGRETAEGSARQSGTGAGDPLSATETTPSPAHCRI